MPLECCMFALDSSEYMRNGDLNPTRLQAQQQAVSTLAQFKLGDNQETSLALLTMAGHKVDVQISPCRDDHKVIRLVKGIHCNGTIDLLTALKVSQLTLRNRVNKYQKQRIVLFIGSPITNTLEQLEKAGKELKKNAVAVDIVLFGSELFIDETNDNIEKAAHLVSTVNTSDNSHLVVYYDYQFDKIVAELSDAEKELKEKVVEKYARFIYGLNQAQSLSDAVVRSAIGRSQQQPGRAQTQAQQAAVAAQQQQQQKEEDAMFANFTITEEERQALADELGMDVGEVTDDLIIAVRMSQQEDAVPTTTTTTTTAPAATPAKPADTMQDGDDDDDDEEMLRLAILASLEEDPPADDAEAEKKKKEEEEKKKKEEEKKKKDAADEDDELQALLKAVGGEDDQNDMTDK